LHHHPFTQFLPHVLPLSHILVDDALISHAS